MHSTTKMLNSSLVNTSFGHGYKMLYINYYDYVLQDPEMFSLRGRLS